MKDRSIGIFDSGLGGLTALKELRALLPNEDLVYFGDTGRVPYGSKSRETILRYAAQDISFIRSHNVKMIVAACGTVSSVLPESAVTDLDVPYVGVVSSAAQAAAAATQKGTIAVIGTAATVRSGSYGKIIRSLRPGVRVIGCACPLFVPLVENGFIGNDCEITRMAIRHYLLPLMKEKPDTMILGCTHFPLLYDLINEELGYEVTLIDPGRETARTVKRLLNEKGLLSDRSREGKTEFYVSDSAPDFSTVASLFLGGDISADVRRIDIESY